jgi:hypothetical protein
LDLPSTLKNKVEKYRGRDEEIYLVGVEFSAKERNVVLFEWEKLLHLPIR